MALFSKKEKRSGTDAAANQKLVDFINGTDLDNNAGIHINEESALNTTAILYLVNGNMVSAAGGQAQDEKNKTNKMLLGLL